MTKRGFSTKKGSPNNKWRGVKIRGQGRLSDPFAGEESPRSELEVPSVQVLQALDKAIISWGEGDATWIKTKEGTCCKTNVDFGLVDLSL